MFGQAHRAARAYAEVVQELARMPGDTIAGELAAERGLSVLDVTWEDTGRYGDSCIGPNISDMTIQVQHAAPRGRGLRLTCMPVIRPPNFSDVSADVPLEKFQLLVGNEKGEPLRKITLRELLQDLRQYLTDRDCWAGEGTSLLADRDTHALVSAQACFLPVPKHGKAEFNPVLFNYQSVAGDPAVLAILATREGTSITAIDNQRDGFSAGRTWGQRLFFNQEGRRASLTGERISGFVATAEAKGESIGKEEQEGLNMVLLIQVPLKQREPEIRAGDVLYVAAPAGAGVVDIMCELSDVEEAVIGHGEIEGPFTEIAGLPIERDERFPVRVTVQFYKASSSSAVSPRDLDKIAEQIRRAYQDADYVGSLVTDGFQGRPTEHTGPTGASPDWWDAFWKRHESNTGQSREEAMVMLQRIRPNWQSLTEEELLRLVKESEQE